METKIYAKATVEKGSNGRMRIIASTEAVDRDGEVIKLDGWDLKNFKQSPMFLWAHNSRELPLGNIVNIKKNKKDGRLEGDIEWASPEANPFAQLVKAQFEEEIMNSFSVGFIPRERDEENWKIITKAELLEISAVPVPANPEARVVMAKGYDQDDANDLLTYDKYAVQKTFNIENIDPNKLAEYMKDFWQDVKTVVPFKSYDLLDKGTAWDGKASEKRVRDSVTNDDDEIDFAQYAKDFTWFDAEKSETLGAYKLPHHDIIEGKFVTNWRGVVAAMGALLGARGGVNIPDADRKRVYNHLAKHYKEFDEEAPAFSDYSEAELKEMFGEEAEEEVKEEKLLITKSQKDLIANAIAALQELLEGSKGVEEPENSDTTLVLSKDNAQRLQFLLRDSKLFGEEVLRQLNIGSKKTDSK
ncbi:MAG: HK97 family phage prohead protease [Candidatus Peribacteraceae bacterium]|nr:HK97 family phage prohead protease [Candidatus Peribacteraceae bacterium]